MLVIIEMQKIKFVIICIYYMRGISVVYMYTIEYNSIVFKNIDMYVQRIFIKNTKYKLKFSIYKGFCLIVNLASVRQVVSICGRIIPLRRLQIRESIRHTSDIFRLLLLWIDFQASHHDRFIMINCYVMW